jgi:hypothetical protein
MQENAEIYCNSIYVVCRLHDNIKMILEKPYTHCSSHLFICSLFNDAFPVTQTMSNERM